MKIKIGVIFGGPTVEHEVSIISAIQAMKSMDENKYEIIPLYISKTGEWYTGYVLRDVENYKDMERLLKDCKNIVLYNKDNTVVIQKKNGFKSIIGEIDIAFPIVHGTNVEDGVLQGYLSTLNIPYVGSSVLGAALGQDKVAMKQVLASANIPQTKYTWFYETEYIDDEDKILKEIKKIGYPVIVKPANLGSSVGISVANSEKDIKEAIELALEYETKIVVEELVPNLIEVNCSVIGNHESQKTSAIEEVLKTEEILSYQDKYLSSNGKGGKTSKGMASTGRKIPARISEKLAKEVRELSIKGFKVLNTSGVCRIDFLINKKTEEIFFNEINTIPGSLSFYLWEPIGLKYSDMLDELIDLAVKNYKIKSKKTYTFDTNILENFNGSKGSKGKLN